MERAPVEEEGGAVRRGAADDVDAGVGRRVEAGQLLGRTICFSVVRITPRAVSGCVAISGRTCCSGSRAAALSPSAYKYPVAWLTVYSEKKSSKVVPALSM